MENPFVKIDERLSNIEKLLAELLAQKSVKTNLDLANEYLDKVDNIADGLEKDTPIKQSKS